MPRSDGRREERQRLGKRGTEVRLANHRERICPTLSRAGRSSVCGAAQLVTHVTACRAPFVDPAGWDALSRRRAWSVAARNFRPRPSQSVRRATRCTRTIRPFDRPTAQRNRAASSMRKVPCQIDRGEERTQSSPRLDSHKHIPCTTEAGSERPYFSAIIVFRTHLWHSMHVMVPSIQVRAAPSSFFSFALVSSCSMMRRNWLLNCR